MTGTIVALYVAWALGWLLACYSVMSYVLPKVKRKSLDFMWELLCVLALLLLIWPIYGILSFLEKRE